MNVGEVKTLSAFGRSTENFPASSFVNNYSISLAAPNSYEIRSNSGVLVASSLDVEQASELINDMSVFAEIGLDELMPYIPYLKKRGSQNGMNIGLDGESSTKEQTMMLRKIYSTIFGEDIQTSNIFDVIRAFKSKTRENGNQKNGMRMHLKKS